MEILLKDNLYLKSDVRQYILFEKKEKKDIETGEIRIENYNLKYASTLAGILTIFMENFNIKNVQYKDNKISEELLNNFRKDYKQFKQDIKNIVTDSIKPSFLEEVETLKARIRELEREIESKCSEQ